MQGQAQCSERRVKNEKRKMNFKLYAYAESIVMFKKNYEYKIILLKKIKL